MGDYVSASIQIGGRIRTETDLRGLISALLNDGIFELGEEARLAIFNAMIFNNLFEYKDDQVNYGRFPRIEDFVTDTPSLWCRTSFGGGWEFDAGTRTIKAGRATDFIGSDGGLVSRSLVRSTLDAGTEALTALLDEMDQLEMGELPPLTASPEVMALLSARK